MSVTLYGLKNCDGCRKAMRWFDTQGRRITFADIREAAHTAAVIKRIAAADDWTPFLNKRSTTWRTLDENQKTGLNKAKALNLMRRHPTLIKRPVIAIGAKTLAGFRPDELA